MDIIIRDVEEKDGQYKIYNKDGTGGHWYITKESAETVSIPLDKPVKPESGGLSERIQNIIETKEGNNELAIFCNGGNMWEFLLGNTSGCVRLGEASGEYETEGATLNDVITKMEIILGDSRFSV